MRQLFFLLVACVFIVSGGSATFFDSSKSFSSSVSTYPSRLIVEKGDAVRHAIKGLRKKNDKLLIYHVWNGYLGFEQGFLDNGLLENIISTAEYKRAYETIIRETEKMARALKKLGYIFEARTAKKAAKRLKKQKDLMLRTGPRKGSYSKVSRYDTFGASDYYASRRMSPSSEDHFYDDYYGDYDNYEFY